MIKYDSDILSALDNALNGGLFNTQRRKVGPEAVKAMQDPTGAAFKSFLAELSNLKAADADSIVATPVLHLGAFAVMAMDKINAELGRCIEVPPGYQKASLNTHDIMIFAMTYEAATLHSVSSVGGELRLNEHAQEAINRVIDICVNRERNTILALVDADGSPVDRLVEEWRSGISRAESRRAQQEAHDAKISEAAERRRKRQLAAGFNDEDIQEGLADDIK